FFFSSRRRHTRSYGDWSSDVCSSDLAVRINDATHLDPFRLGAHLQTLAGDDADRTTADSRISCYQSLAVISFVFIERIGVDDSEIGRASCRDGVWIVAEGK